MLNRNDSSHKLSKEERLDREKRRKAFNKLPHTPSKDPNTKSKVRRTSCSNISENKLERKKKIKVGPLVSRSLQALKEENSSLNQGLSYG